MSQLGSTISAEKDKNMEAQNESDGDPAASDVQVPDAPARPKMKKTVTLKGRELLPPSCHRNDLEG